MGIRVPPYLAGWGEDKDIKDCEVFGYCSNGSHVSYLGEKFGKDTKPPTSITCKKSPY